MAKKTGASGHVVNRKKTSVGRKNVGFSTMNKSKRRSFKAYRGQGR